MRKVVFVGNCQAAILWNIYTNLVAPTRGDSTYYIESYQSASAEDMTHLNNADKVVCQLFDMEQKFNFDDNELGDRVILVPNLTLAFLWPYAGVPHIKHGSRPIEAAEPFWGQWGDRFLNAKIKENIDPDYAAREYMNLDIAKIANLDRLYTLVMEGARQRDERSGFCIVGEIEKSFRVEHIFLTFSHPNLRMTVYYTMEVFRRLGVPNNVITDVLGRWRKTPFPHIAVPIHPGVCRHFGLKFADSDYRFEFYTGEMLPFQEYARRYMALDWNAPLFRGIARFGVATLSEAEVDEVIADLECGLRRGFPSARGLFAWAHLMVRRGRREEAIRAMRRVVELDPAETEYADRLAAELVTSGEAVEAERICRSILDAAPHSVWTFNALVNALDRQGRRVDAIEAARKARTLQPDNPHWAAHLTRFGAE